VASETEPKQDRLDQVTKALADLDNVLLHTSVKMNGQTRERHRVVQLFLQSQERALTNSEKPARGTLSIQAAQSLGRSKFCSKCVGMGA